MLFSCYICCILCLCSFKREPSRQSSSQNESFASISENLLKSRNWTFPVVRYFSRKLDFVSNILWMIVASFKE